MAAEDFFKQQFSITGWDKFDWETHRFDAHDMIDFAERYAQSHKPDVSGSLPPRHPFIDALVENTECAARDEGIYFADSIRGNEEKTDWFNKMIEDYQRQ